jgi:hypothetical protein
MFEHSASWFQWLIRVNQLSRKRNLPQLAKNSSQRRPSIYIISNPNTATTRQQIQKQTADPMDLQKTKETRQQPQRTDFNDDQRNKKDITTSKPPLTAAPDKTDGT